jgi:NAD(P)-dependent dehydrogenase (short-subunit alcohol dehydrogenase family)
MAKRLQGKSAVVTGSGRGICRGIALALAAEGAKVVVNDIAREPDGTSVADKVVKEITKAKGTAVANYDSVAIMEGGQNIINTAISNFDGIDILVNGAGNFMPMPSFEMTEEVWDSIIAVNLKGQFSCYKAAAPKMIQQKSGRIINLSSRAAFYSPPGCVAYCAAKAGVMGFSADLARELAPHGITVNCILPAAITQLFPRKKMPMGDHMPVPLIAEPDFVAPIVTYLATDEAQGVTGRFIYAAGGDIAIYADPIQLTSAHRFIRKMGKWTVDELSDLMPPLLGLSD